MKRTWAIKVEKKKKGRREILFYNEAADKSLFFSLAWGGSLKGGECGEECAWEKKLETYLGERF